MNFEGLDEIDNRILEILLENGRASYSMIGECVGLTRVAVKNRVERLEREGFIAGYKAILGEAHGNNKLKNVTRFLVDMVMNPEDLIDAMNYLCRYDIVKKVYAITGESRIHCEGAAGSEVALKQLFMGLKNDLKGVRSLTIQNVLYIAKNVEEDN